MLEELLQKRAIVPLPDNAYAFFNRVFLITKRAGGFRLILDVSILNEFLRVSMFRMNKVQSIRLSVEQNMWAVSIDLSDTYHHISTGTKTSWRSRWAPVGRFCYAVCPFRLSPAPQVITETLTLLKLHAR